MNTYPTYLAHHGVKGMKWGVRRYENKDGSLTPAGRKRYGEAYEKALKEAHQAKADWKKNKTQGKMVKKNLAAERAQNEKIKANVRNKGKTDKIKAQEKALKKKYNLTDEEAEIQAYKNRQIKKTLAIAGGVAVTAAVAYAAYRHYDRNVDKIIKSGTKIQNINTAGDKMDWNRGFYGATSKHDKAKYAGMYAGGQLRGMAGPEGKIYKSTLTVGKNGIKVASDKSATKALQSVLSDVKARDELAANCKNYANPFSKQGMAFQRAAKSLQEGKVDKNVYSAFNVLLTGNNLSSSTKNSFYDTLRKEGFGAIPDHNDRRYSGYAAKTATIIFGDKKTNVFSKVDTIEMGKQALDSGFKKETTKHVSEALAKDGAKTVAMYGGLALGIAGASNVSKNQRNMNWVKDYREEHPNSKLSQQEIVQLKEKEQRR